MKKIDMMKRDIDSRRRKNIELTNNQQSVLRTLVNIGRATPSEIRNFSDKQLTDSDVKYAIRRLKEKDFVTSISKIGEDMRKVIYEANTEKQPIYVPLLD